MIQTTTKIRLLQSLVLSVFLYGCQRHMLRVVWCCGPSGSPSRRPHHLCAFAQHCCSSLRVVEAGLSCSTHAVDSFKFKFKFMIAREGSKRERGSDRQKIERNEKKENKRRTFLPFSSTILDLLLQPKNADVQNARGSKAPAGLAADAKEQAGTANCSQTAQQKLTQLPDEAGTNARRREKAQQQTKNAPPPRSTKRSTTCRCWSPAHKRRKAPADEHTGSKNRRAFIYIFIYI